MKGPLDKWYRSLDAVKLVLLNRSWIPKSPKTNTWEEKYHLIALIRQQILWKYLAVLHSPWMPEAWRLRANTECFGSAGSAARIKSGEKSDLKGIPIAIPCYVQKIRDPRRHDAFRSSNLVNLVAKLKAEFHHLLRLSAHSSCLHK